MTATANTVVKAASKKSQALAIFNAKLAERGQGLYPSNKAFRAAVLTAIETELSVTRASASTMYNSAFKGALETDPNVGLGRDPKKVKAPSTGKRGRPFGSKNRAKTEVTAEVAPVVAETAAA